MAFADEPVGYSGRRFECGWSGRSQTAADIADRVRGLAQLLGEIHPAWGRICPDPGMRKFRPGDLCPVVDMDRVELADLIDCDGRFDPPKPPAPVSPKGFSVTYRNDLKGLDPSFLSLSVRAGQYGGGWAENRVGLRPDAKHELWRDVGRGVEVLEAMVGAWDPEWASAYALVQFSSENNEMNSRALPLACVGGQAATAETQPAICPALSRSLSPGSCGPSGRGAPVAWGRVAHLAPKVRASQRLLTAVPSWARNWRQR